MRLLSVTVIALAGIAAAFPGFGAGHRKLVLTAEPAIKPRQLYLGEAVDLTLAALNFQEPQPGEVRGCCPALNSLANHDICPRSGKGYTIPILLECMGPGLGIGPDFINLAGGLGLATNPANFNVTLTNSSSFDLDHLNNHNNMEHDASLSRADFNVAQDDHTFDSGVWNQVLEVFGDNDPNITTAAAARTVRFVTTQATTPGFALAPNLASNAILESCLYLQVMGSSRTANAAPLGFVKSLFELEKLPILDGWIPAQEVVDLDSLTPCVNTIQAATAGFNGLDKRELTIDDVAAAMLG